MPFFSKVFKSKDASSKPVSTSAKGVVNKKPQWSDAWLRTRVDPEEVVELLHLSTAELKSRGLDVPLLILPFRPSSDPSAARTFVRNYFYPPNDREQLRGHALANELRMTEVMVIISVMKWCWARLPGGVVTWETYEMFRVGERDSKFARNAFTTFLPISVDSKARAQIIRDYFDLLAAVAAHGKTNGLSGHKLSRYAGWWAFEHYDTGKGFEAGYRAWTKAANATSHLFFAYLRSLSPEPGKTNGIHGLPRSLEQLLASVEYPPNRALLSSSTTRVIMIVDAVSPTPYALLRRAKNFEYRDDDRALQELAGYDDPVQALTDECRRVLKSISSANQSHVSNAQSSTSLVDPSWSRFEDIGFGSTIEEADEDNGFISRQPLTAATSANGHYEDIARPITPSWADFLSIGFNEENGKTTGPVLLPPDKILPRIDTAPRGQSSQSHRRNADMYSQLQPGEIASITKVELDDAFWWVWISSLAGEEPTSRKAAFGRCALIETTLDGGQWLVMEEQVKGAAPEPAAGAYIAEKKSFLGFTKRSRLTRRRSQIKKSPLSPEPNDFGTTSPATIAPDQQARIQKAAAELAREKQVQEEALKRPQRNTENMTLTNRNSVLTLGPLIQDEASPAMKWASQYDKKEVRAKYLGDNLAGKGSQELLTLPNQGIELNRSTSTLSGTAREHKELPVPPKGTAPSVESPAAAVLPTTESVNLPESTHQYGDFRHEPAVLTPPMQSAQPQPDIELIPSQPQPSPDFRRAESPTLQRIPRKSIDGGSPVLPRIPRKSVESGPPTTHQIPRKSVEAASHRPEQPETSQSATTNTSQRATAIRRLFGTKKGRSPEIPRPRTPETPVEPNPAVLAARQALEGKLFPTKQQEPLSPPFQAGYPTKMKINRQPVTAVQTIVQTPMPPPPQPVTAPPAPPPAQITPPPLVTEAPAVPAHDVAPISPVMSKPTERQITHSDAEQSDMDDDREGRSSTQLDEEHDDLSRVSTDEHERANHSFPSMNHAQFYDAVPEKSDFAFEDGSAREVYPIPEEEPFYRPTHLSVYSAVTVPEDDEEEKLELTQEPSPQDRWAQIRKNAAERAARHSEEAAARSRTDTRTDDGETSGEETIESRVARIKARVAELTGNMEAVRR